MKPKYPIDESILRIKAWCDRQERCHQEVKQKLASWGVFGEDQDHILSELIENNYLNEERFAKAYVSGKFRIKGWGRKKILQGLKARNISDYCIKSGLIEIDEEEYVEFLNRLSEKKLAENSELSLFDNRGKTAQYLIRRGFEKDLVWKIILNEE